MFDFDFDIPGWLPGVMKTYAYLTVLIPLAALIFLIFWFTRRTLRKEPEGVAAASPRAREKVFLWVGIVVVVLLAMPWLVTGLRNLAS